MGKGNATVVLNRREIQDKLCKYVWMSRDVGANDKGLQTCERFKEVL
jgi:hypothetical protein